MHDSKRWLAGDMSLGDAAVDGLMGGIGAGFAMLVILLAAGMLRGQSPINVLQAFDLTGEGVPLKGLLTHLAVSSVYGTLFGLSARLVLGQKRLAAAIPAWLLGLAFGLALYALAALASASGAWGTVGGFDRLSFLLAHLAYGLLLGLLVQRAWRRQH